MECIHSLDEVLTTTRGEGTLLLIFMKTHEIGTAEKQNHYDILYDTYYDIFASPILRYNGRIDLSLYVQSSLYPLDALMLFEPFLAMNLQS